MLNKSNHSSLYAGSATESQDNNGWNFTQGAQEPAGDQEASLGAKLFSVFGGGKPKNQAGATKRGTVTHGMGAKPVVGHANSANAGLKTFGALGNSQDGKMELTLSAADGSQKLNRSATDAQSFQPHSFSVVNGGEGNSKVPGMLSPAPGGQQNGMGVGKRFSISSNNSNNSHRKDVTPMLSVSGPSDRAMGKMMSVGHRSSVGQGPGAMTHRPSMGNTMGKMLSMSKMTSLTPHGNRGSAIEVSSMISAGAAIEVAASMAANANENKGGFLRTAATMGNLDAMTNSYACWANGSTAAVMSKQQREEHLEHLEMVQQFCDICEDLYAEKNFMSEESEETISELAPQFVELAELFTRRQKDLPLSINEKGTVKCTRPFRKYLPSTKSALASAIHEEYQFSGFPDGTTILWYWRSDDKSEDGLRQCEEIYTDHQKPVRSVQVSHESSMLASVCDSGLVVIRKAQQGNDDEPSYPEMQFQLPLFRGARVNHMRTGAVGTLTSPSDVLWDDQKVSVPILSDGPTPEVDLLSPVCSMCFVGIDDEEVLVLGTNNGVLLKMDIESQSITEYFVICDQSNALLLRGDKAKKRVQGPSISCLEVSVSEPSIILAGTLEHTIIVVDVEASSIIRTFRVGTPLKRVMMNMGDDTRGKEDNLLTARSICQGIRCVAGWSSLVFAAFDVGVWVVQGDRGAQEIGSHDSMVTALALTRDTGGVTGSRNDTWLLVSGSEQESLLRLWAVRPAPIDSLKKAGNYLVSALADDETGLPKTLGSSTEDIQGAPPVTSILMAMNQNGTPDVIAAHKDKLISVYHFGRASTGGLVCEYKLEGNPRETAVSALAESRETRQLIFAIGNQVIACDYFQLLRAELQQRSGDRRAAAAVSSNGLTPIGNQEKKDGLTVIKKFDHDDKVNCLFIPENRDTVIYSGSNDGSVRSWDLTRPQEDEDSDAEVDDLNDPLSAQAGLTFEHRDQSAVTALCVSRNRQEPLLFAGDRHGVIHVWDAAGVTEPVKLQSMPLHRSTVLSLSTNSGKTCVTGSADNTMCILVREDSGDQWELSRTLCSHDGSVTGVFLSHHGRRAFSSSTDTEVHIWDLHDTSQPQRILKGHKNGVTAMLVSADQQTLYTADISGYIVIWDIISGTQRQVLNGQKSSGSRIVGLALVEGKGADEEPVHIIVSVAVDFTVRFWRLEHVEKQHRKGHLVSVSSVRLSQDGETALSGSLDGKLILWDTEGQSQRSVFQGHLGPVFAVDMSLDGKFLASGSADNTVRLWDRSNNSCVAVLQKSDFTRESEAGLPEVSQLIGHLDQVTAVKFSVPSFGEEDSLKLISGGLDKYLIAWDLKSKLANQCYRHSSGIQSVTINRAGDCAVIGGVDGLVVLVKIPAEGDALYFGDEGTNALDDVFDEDLDKAAKKDKRSSVGCGDHLRFAAKSTKLQAQKSTKINRSGDDGRGSGKMARLAKKDDRAAMAIKINNQDSKDMKRSEDSDDEDEAHDEVDCIPSKNFGNVVENALKQKNGKRGHGQSLLVCQQPSMDAGMASRSSFSKPTFTDLWKSAVSKIPSRRESKTLAWDAEMSMSVGGKTGKDQESWMKSRKSFIGLLPSKPESEDKEPPPSRKTNLKLNLDMDGDGGESSTVAGNYSSLSRSQISHSSTVDFKVDDDESDEEADGGLPKNVRCINDVPILPAYDLRYHSAAVNAIEYSLDESILVAGSDDNTVSVWSLSIGPTWATLIKVLKHDDSVRCLALTSDFRHVITGCADSVLTVWDLPCATIEKRCVGHTEAVECCALSGDNMRLISGGSERELIVWDLWHGSSDWVFDAHESGVMSCSMAACGRTVATGGNDNSVTITDIRTGAVECRLLGHAANVAAVRLNSRGEKLLSGGWDARLLLWDVASGRIQQEFCGHNEAVQCCDMTDDGSVIVSGSRTGRLIFWDLEIGRPRLRENGNPLCFELNGSCRCMSLMNEGAILLAATDSECALTLWNVETGDTLGRHAWAHESPITSVKAATANWFVFSASLDGTVIQWKYDQYDECLDFMRELGASTRLFRHLASGGVESLSCSAGGDRLLIAGKTQNAVSLWNVNDDGAEEHPVAVWCSHHAKITSVGLSVDGLLAMSCSLDREVHLHPVGLNSSLWFNFRSLMTMSKQDSVMFRILLRSNPQCVHDKIYPIGWGLLHWLSALNDFRAIKMVLETAGSTPLGFCFDLLGQTPLDIACGKTNLEMADYFLQQASKWPVHCTEFATLSVCRLLEHNLSNMPLFLDSRIGDPIEHRGERIPQRAYLKNGDQSKMEEDLALVGLSSSAFSGLPHDGYEILVPGCHDSAHVQGAGGYFPIAVRCLYLHCIMQPELGFLAHLTSSDDHKLFLSKSVRLILHYKWHSFGRRRHLRSVARFLLQLSTFSVFALQLSSNYHGTQLDAGGGIGVWLPGVMPCVLAIRVLFKEGRTVIVGMIKHSENRGGTHSLWHYCWQYMAIAANCGVLSVGIGVFFGILPEEPAHIIAGLTTLSLWIQAGNLFRGFRGFGALVRTLIEIFNDTRFFMAMMVCMTLAFGEVLHIVRTDSADVGWEGSVYSIWKVYAATWTGSYATQVYENSPLQTCIFILCSLTMSVISLNLLIAIIQQTYTRVRTSGTMAFYKELADLLLKIERSETQIGFDHNYLIFATRRFAMLRGATEEEEEEAMEEALLGVDEQNILPNLMREVIALKKTVRDIGKQVGGLSDKVQYIADHKKNKDAQKHKQDDAHFDGGEGGVPADLQHRRKSNTGVDEILKVTQGRRASGHLDKHIAREGGHDRRMTQQDEGGRRASSWEQGGGQQGGGRNAPPLGRGMSGSIAQASGGNRNSSMQQGGKPAAGLREKRRASAAVGPLMRQMMSMKEEDEDGEEDESDEDEDDDDDDELKFDAINESDEEDGSDSISGSSAAIGMGSGKLMRHSVLRTGGNQSANMAKAKKPVRQSIRGDGPRDSVGLVRRSTATRQSVVSERSSVASSERSSTSSRSSAASWSLNRESQRSSTSSWHGDWQPEVSVQDWSDPRTDSSGAAPGLSQHEEDEADLAEFEQPDSGRISRDNVPDSLPPRPQNPDPSGMQGEAPSSDSPIPGEVSV